MKRAFIILVLIGFAAAPAAAQGKGKGKNKVPPGHMPSPGECRVWYDGVPPGHQPEPTSCAQAERIASRSPNARVIYGSDRGRWERDDRWGRDDDRWENRRDDDWWERDDERRRREAERGRRDDGRRERSDDARTTGRAIPRVGGSAGSPPDSSSPSRRGSYGSVAFRTGYDDGVTKGREDTRDGDAFDPARHSWYKSANRGYNSRYGSREQYREEYRDGFLDGYREAYRGDTTTRSRPSWWPF